MSSHTVAESTAENVIAALATKARPEIVPAIERFFKTGPGQYGEGDKFIGIKVPETRAIMKPFRGLPITEAMKLLASPIHEHRLAGLISLNDTFETASKAKTRDNAKREEVVDRYLEALSEGQINNWDLVDCSAEFTVGEYLYDRDRSLLFDLVESPSLWDRRVAVLSTFAFIKHGDASTTLELAEKLLADKEDLIQKAVGWMLREVGKRVDRSLLRTFLDKNAANMPRTMLSYAIEHFDPETREHYRNIRL